MSVHKLTAGSGYDYLTRQVAALDATERGHVGLASYYTARGESPGVWVGSGMAGIDGLAVGDVVTAEQMQALFGSGHHPLAAQRRGQLQGPGLSEGDYREVGRLGAPYRVYPGDVSAFRVEVARRIAAVNEAAGVPGDWPVPATDRARVRTAVAAEFFRAEHGREPEGARELAATISKHSRPMTTAVAGYDLTFSPVKSVSALWAIADPSTAARIERAHRRAVADALAFIEAHALYTRTGTNGLRQVDVRGLVAAAFTHRDSRAGDPDLHTHVAVANKVQTLDGRWLSIDGRVLFKAAVTASETYNTALERHLGTGLGVVFAQRPGSDPRKRPVREIVSVPIELTARWSQRRARIDVRRGELAADFQRSHGRPPTPVEALGLAQQATLETREAKHEPRTLAEQRATWHREAAETLGGADAVTAVLTQVVSPTWAPSTGVAQVPTSGVVAAVADRVVAEVEGRRATWQVWHVRSEAHRQVRGLDVRAEDSEALVDRVVAEVLQRRSIALSRPEPGIVEPEVLRRRDGSSVYTVAGAALYTSGRVLDAEQRLVAAAGRRDGHVVPGVCVDLALLESQANGVALTAGQAGLVRQMATSGARLQVAIAPAGAGKTTAMRALAAAWAEGGGTLIGLAPSAAAAAVLREQLGTDTDTLAKVTWGLQAGDLPGWAGRIGPSTLVIVDEAGMADTLSLDTVAGYVLARGASLRLIGDDQQLTAIGAGGVLRDIAATHGAVHLRELMRFTDPAEAAASLALREGRPEALGFYLDARRVHVGDLTTMTDDTFTAWLTDRGRGLDSVMLAPTRDLAAELNQRARTHRLASAAAACGVEVSLADGNQASTGEVVITRQNRRALRVTASDWVKNGDRWRVLAVHDDAALTVQHLGHGHRVRLPAGYVAASVELGYATTIHAAQGISADTMHGLATGAESRQQLYTMLTRGRIANHLYLQTCGDGDPHTVIRPELIHPPTPTEVLEQVLARDDAPRSASTQLRDLDDPARQLGAAAARYIDALHMAAEDVAAPGTVAGLDRAADQVLADLSEAPAWPTLRAHLLLVAAAGGADPVAVLREAAAAGEMDTARDAAAVLDWRLDASGLRHAGPGPLPWVPAVPAALAAHPRWGAYLRARSQRVADLAARVHARAVTDPRAPVWARPGTGPLTPGLVAEITVWRAATGVEATDRRPTGPRQLATAAATWQRGLDQRLTGHAPAMAEWGPLLHAVAPALRHDPYTPVLAEQLAAISRAGLNAPAILAGAATGTPLPDDHAAAAVWWRISRHLSPAVLIDLDHDPALTTPWTPRLIHLLGPGRAAAVQDSRWWPALAGVIEQGLRRGWRLEDLLAEPTGIAAADIDDCQALTWRASILINPAPAADTAPAPTPTDTSAGTLAVDPPPGETAPGEDGGDLAVASGWGADDDAVLVEVELAVAAVARGLAGPPGPSDAAIERMLSRAIDAEQSPVSPERIAELNEAALCFFQEAFAGSWGRGYLLERFGVDLHRHPLYRPGQAPAGWTRLTEHLRRRGAGDAELLAAGLAVTARTGRLIDRFRDRVVFPILAPGADDAGGGVVLGFIARRHRDHDDTSGPKYLNTADTVLYRKGAQLYGAHHRPTHPATSPTPSPGIGSAIPVLVEGPMDAIAVTLAGGGRYLGVAPLGTSLTEEQAAGLAQAGRDPVVATDADLAGQVGAERAYWLLTAHRLDPRHARLPAGSDPADLLTAQGPTALAAALDAARPLGEVLLEERLTTLPADQALPQALAVIAARPAPTWDSGLGQITDRLHLPEPVARRGLLEAVRGWTRDPRQAATAPLSGISAVRERLAAVAGPAPPQRWAALAAALDPRLSRQGDWPALAAVLQQAHDEGHDITTLTHRLVAEAPLDDRPALDLRYRITSHLDLAPAREMPPRPGGGRAGEHHRAPTLPAPQPTASPVSPGRGR